MQHKKTVVFFTETDRCNAANAVREEFCKGKDTIGVLVTKKELESRFWHGVYARLLPEEKSLRNKVSRIRGAVSAARMEKCRKKGNAITRKKSLQRRVGNVIVRYNPDVIVVTAYSYLKEIVDALDKQGKEDIKIVVVCDEFVLDKRLIHKGVDYYFVANYEMRKELIDCGINETVIKVIDIPVLSDRKKTVEREDAIKKLAVSPEKPTVIVSASMRGDDRFRKLIVLLAEKKEEWNIAVLCGKNRSLLNFVREKGLSAFNEGVDMTAALYAADVVVARPTATLLAESALIGKKVISFLPNGKMEKKTAEYLSIDFLTKADEEEDVLTSVRFLLGEEVELEIAENAPLKEEDIPSLDEVIFEDDEGTEGKIDSVAVIVKELNAFIKNK